MTESLRPTSNPESAKEQIRNDWIQWLQKNPDVDTQPIITGVEFNFVIGEGEASRYSDLLSHYEQMVHLATSEEQQAYFKNNPIIKNYLSLLNIKR